MANEQEQDTLTKRQALLALAKRQADEGAHYLWGAEGLRPKSSAPKDFAAVVLDKGQASQTTFCAATLNGSVCAGRCFHRDLGTVTPTPKLVSNPDGSPELLSFITRNQPNPNAQYNWGFELTPRVIRGDKIMDYSSRPPRDVTDQLVWGEGCDDTLHFDCGGFVRWVARHYCKVSIAGIGAAGMGQYGQVLGRVLENGEPMMPADILVYPGHIGFAIAAHQETYSTVGSYALAQAECATLGVTYGNIHGQHNLRCIRLTNETLSMSA